MEIVVFLAPVAGWLCGCYFAALLSSKYKNRALPTWVWVLAAVPPLLVLIGVSAMVDDPDSSDDIQQIGFHIFVAAVTFVLSLALAAIALLFVRKKAIHAVEQEKPVNASSGVVPEGSNENKEESDNIELEAEPAKSNIDEAEESLEQRVRREEQLRLKIRAELQAENDKAAQELSSPRSQEAKSNGRADKSFDLPIFRVLLFGGLVWAYFEGHLDKILQELGFGTSKPVAELTCADLTAIASGQDLMNAFGARIKIISVDALAERTRDEKSLECVGTAELENGNSVSLSVRAEQEDTEILYRFSTE